MARPPYTCARCGYKTHIKSSMYNHLYRVKKPCPSCKETIVELTDAIKDFIMTNRIYNHVLQDKLKDSRPETFYQSVVERYLRGTHKRLESGYITDISTEDTHVEIKKWKNFRESIGQLLSYNAEDHKPYLQVYLFGTKTNKIKEVATRIFKSLDIKMFTFDIDTKHVDIIDLDTNKKVFTCHIYNDELITTYVEIPKEKAEEKAEANEERKVECVNPTTPDKSCQSNETISMTEN
jgi:hypothetical protein